MMIAAAETPAPAHAENLRCDDLGLIDPKMEIVMTTLCIVQARMKSMRLPARS